MDSKWVSGGVLSSRRKVSAFVVVVVTGLGVMLQSWSAVNAGVVESRLLPVRPVTVCVDGQGVVSRVLVDGSCGGVVATWSSKSPAPQLCWDTSSLAPIAESRIVSVRPSSGCDSQQEAIVGGLVTLCADKSTGVLRWPVTKICRTGNIATKVMVGSSVFGRSPGTSSSSTTTTTTTSTTTTSTTVALARAPQVSRISADTTRVRFTLSGMSPDTGNYAVQWVERGQSFNTYNMRQVTERDVALPIGDFACGGRTYTFRVFVMRSDWTLSQGHSNQNVTPHSELFDITTTHACPVATTVANTGGDTTTTTTTLPPTLGAWVSRNAVYANAWYGITYGNGRYVAVGYRDSDSSYFSISSTDGESWTQATNTFNSRWQSVAFGNGTFVAVASGGADQIMTSTNGLTWTNRVAAASRQWYSVAYGGGIFVAVAVDGAVMTSADNGATWSLRTAAVTNQWYSVTYGNGLFVAVSVNGTGNRVMTSPDGITWTARTSAANNSWNSVVYGGGMFVAVAASGTGNRVMTSPDGITWTARTSAADNSWRSVTYGNGLFVAVSSDGTSRVMTSPDGLTWTLGSAATENPWWAVTYGDRLFVAVSLTSTNHRVMTATYR